MGEPTLLGLLEETAKEQERRAVAFGVAYYGAQEFIERRDHLRAAAARLREEMERASRGGNDWLLALRALERVNGAASPPPATGTGMEPGQRCTYGFGHAANIAHSFDGGEDDVWRRGAYFGERCPYVEPAPPPATCGTCKTGDDGER